MKKQILSILFIAIVLFTTTCKKEEAIVDLCVDPQLPGEYFPAYPKTWWRYRQNNNEFLKYEISEEYEMCHEKCRPVFLNTNNCIQGNSLMHVFGVSHGMVAESESPIYSLDLNKEMVCIISFSTLQIIPFSMGSTFEDIHFRRVTIKMDTSITVNNINYSDVILVKEFSLEDPNHLFLDYFAKDIGLIKREKIIETDSTDQFVNIMTLENYHIEK